MWIRILLDPRSFSLLDPDPDPGGENLRGKQKKCNENERKL